MKTIGLVSNTSWSIYNFRLGLIKALKKEGYRIVVIAPEDEFTPFLKKEISFFEHLPLKNYSVNPIDDFQSFRRLFRLYKKYDPDFLFHYTAKPNIYGSIAASLNKIPSIPIVTGLGYPFTTRSFKTKVVKWLYNLALSRVKEVWFLNESDASIFTESDVIPESKVRFLPSEGVNTRQYYSLRQERTSGNIFRFLFAGRMIAEKGVYEYVQAARILKKKRSDVEFNLLGFFDKENPGAITKAEVAQWEKEGVIRYQGATNDVRPFLDQADCIVLPSYYREGIPRILLEGASMGVPLISTDNVGCRQVVKEGFNGYLCPKKDVAQLARCMEKMTELPVETLEVFGENGRELVTTFFDEKIVISRYLKLLEKSFGKVNNTVELTT